jgi:hypothetical protein
VENSIIVVSSSASCFEIGISAESYLFVEIHTLLSFNVFIKASICNFLCAESKT